jgi:hypothetical protein
VIILHVKNLREETIFVRRGACLVADRVREFSVTVRFANAEQARQFRARVENYFLQVTQREDFFSFCLIFFIVVIFFITVIVFFSLWSLISAFR